MDTGLHRAEFDFDLTDLVDVHMRTFLRSQFGKRQVLLAGLSAFLSFVVVLALCGLRYSSEIAIALGLSGLIVGIPVGYLGRSAYVQMLQRRIRRALREHHDERNSFHCEFELRSEGVWIKQEQVEVLNPWQRFVAADDAPDGIELRFIGGGIALVRNRAFRTLDARSAFLERARALGAAAKN